MASFTVIDVSLGDVAEEALDAIQPGTLTRMMALGIAGQGSFEVLKDLLLLRGEVDGGLHHHPAKQVASRPAANGPNAFLTQTEAPAGLRFGRHLDDGVPVQG
ncbi:MAG: hypothetical protein ACO3IZ_09565, partial [Steroidobacteraceae bacterium]